LPSIEMRKPDRRSRSAQTKDVNWLTSVSFNASTQKPAWRVQDAPRQHLMRQSPASDRGPSRSCSSVHGRMTTARSTTRRLACPLSAMQASPAGQWTNSPGRFGSIILRLTCRSRVQAFASKNRWRQHSPIVLGPLADKGSFPNAGMQVFDWLFVDLGGFLAATLKDTR